MNFSDIKIEHHILQNIFIELFNEALEKEQNEDKKSLFESIYNEPFFVKQSLASIEESLIICSLIYAIPKEDNFINIIKSLHDIEKENLAIEKIIVFAKKYLNITPKVTELRIFFNWLRERVFLESLSESLWMGDLSDASSVLAGIRQQQYLEILK